MVFRHHRQPLHRRVIRRPLRYRPRLQHSLHLQAKVVVKTSCRMLLNDEDRQLGLLRFPSRRLRGRAEVAHGAVFLEQVGHGCWVAELLSCCCVAWLPGCVPGCAPLISNSATQRLSNLVHDAFLFLAVVFLRATGLARAGFAVPRPLLRLRRSASMMSMTSPPFSSSFSSGSIALPFDLARMRSSKRLRYSSLNARGSNFFSVNSSISISASLTSFSLAGDDSRSIVLKSRTSSA